MKYFLKVKSGKTNQGVEYNKILDSLSSESIMYLPWIEASEDAFKQYQTMKSDLNSGINTLTNAFADALIKDGKITSIGASIIPPGVVLL